MSAYFHRRLLGGTATLLISCTGGFILSRAYREGCFHAHFYGAKAVLNGGLFA